VSVDGPGLYQNDTGHDVRSELRELLADGKSASEATDALLSRWSQVFSFEEERIAFYLALADAQWHLGYLDERIRSEAVRLVDSGEALRGWETTPAFFGKRQAVLGQLARRLATEPGPPKRVAKRKTFQTTLKRGDVFMHTAADGTRYLLEVVDHNRFGDYDTPSVYAVLRVLTPGWLEPLTPEVVAALKPVPGTNGPASSIILAPYRGTDMPKNCTRWLGNWRSGSLQPPREFSPGMMARAGSNLDRIVQKVVKGYERRHVGAGGT
jgi:hypothetical protein